MIRTISEYGTSSVLIFMLAAIFTVDSLGQEPKSSGIPEKYGQAWVYCRTENVTVVGNRKEKKCGEQTWHTSKGDNPSATEVFYWRDIIISAYDDNKTIRFTFDDLRAGWGLRSPGMGYGVFVYLLDANFTSLVNDGIRVFPGQQTNDPDSIIGYRPPTCEIPEPNRWRSKVFEVSLKGTDQTKYDDIAHMVFVMETWNGGVGFKKC
jgi:hypothetical protein